MNRIDQLFDRVKKSSTAGGSPTSAFIAFLTAGDPDLTTTERLARAFAEESRRREVPFLLEIGFPYSDPIADGPTIQTSYTRALNKGIKVQAIFEMVRSLRQHVDIPLVGMVSFSLVLKRGVKEFLQSSRTAGLDGLIIADLPIEESKEVYRLAEVEKLKIIQLIAPTSPQDRAERIARESTGFVYYVSVAGITGARRTLPTDLGDRIRAIRQLTATPVCVGFGISEPSQVAELRGIADGIIVGSALVKGLGGIPSVPNADIGPVVDQFISLIEPLRNGR